MTSANPIPQQVYLGTNQDRVDLMTTHEEADVIIPQQVASAARHVNTSIIVISDDADVFILLAHFYIHEKLTFQLSMQGTNPSRTLVDIAATDAKHQEIIPYLLAAHALSGCDTVAHMWGIG